MGRVSDYSIKKEKETLEERKKKIQEKIGKDDLKAKEIAIYLNIDEKTIKNRIKQLCKMNPDLLEIYFKKNGCYIVKPKIQGIFFCLMNSRMFDNHRNAPGYKKYIIDELIKNIGNELDEEDKKQIYSKPSYLKARLESKLIEQYFLTLHLLNKTLFEMDDLYRLRYIEKTIHMIRRMNVSLETIRKSSDKHINKIKNVMPNSIINENMNETLEKMLISMMVTRLRKNRQSENKKDSLEIIKKIMFRMEKYDEESMELKEKYIEEIVFPIDRYKELEKKVDSVFDLNDDIEKQIAIFIKETFADVYSMPILDEINTEEKADARKRQNTEDMKEDMYKNFFKTYMQFSQYAEVTQSEDYKTYLKIKDNEEVKELLSRYK